MEHLKPRREAFLKQPSLGFAGKPCNILNNSQFTPKSTTATINGHSSSSSYLEPPNNPIHTIQKASLGLRAEDSEISIFDATKYFNGIDDPKGGNINKHISNTSLSSIPKPSDASSSITRFSSVSSVDDGYGMINFRARSFRSTPTSYSEASWNSQTGLLANPPGSVAVSIRNIHDNTTDKTSNNRAGSAVTKFFRGTKCPCSGKKSVQVEQSLTSESEIGRTLGIARLKRSNSIGSTSLYSSTRQSSPRTLPPYPITATASPKTKIQLPNEPTRDVNFISRPTTFDQTKLPSGTATNPIMNRFQPQKPFTPDRVTISARTFPEGNGTTSNGFTFPVLNNSNNPTGNRNFNVIRPPLPLPAIVDPPRDSLEVFQPRVDSDIVMKSEVKEQHRTLALPVSPRSRRTSYDDEACSEASSDLFEIESFSTHAASYPHRDSLEDPTSTFNVRRFQISNAIESSNAVFRRSIDEETTAPTEIYAPSEVSVDWSVTTAEGYDRASLTNFSVSASELGYAAMKREAEAEEAARRKGGGEGEGRSKAGNGVAGLSLMNCRCEKAVSVGPKPVKCGEGNGPTSVTWGHVSGRVQAHDKTKSNKRHEQAQAHLVNVGNKRK